MYDKALSDEEAGKVPVCYFVQDDVLMRKYRKFIPPEIPVGDEWRVLRQIVVPSKYRSEILNIAHANKWSLVIKPRQLCWAGLIAMLMCVCVCVCVCVC